MSTQHNTTQHNTTQHKRIEGESPDPIVGAAAANNHSLTARVIIVFSFQSHTCAAQ